VFIHVGGGFFEALTKFTQTELGLARVCFIQCKAVYAMMAIPGRSMAFATGIDRI